MLRTFFNKLSGKKTAPQNWLNRRDVDFLILTEGKPGETFVRHFSEGDDFARCRYELSTDEKEFSFEMHLRRGGKDYKTFFKATLPRPSTYVVQNFVFEGVREELKTAAETYNALNYIANQIRGMTVTRKITWPHDPASAPFSKLSRAYMRFMS